MNPINCDRVRDLLPMQAPQDEATEAAVAAHLVHCAECRAEAELVSLLRHALEPVPAGLESRVVAAVRVRRPARLFTPARMAMAATVAAAVIGGSALLSRGTQPEAAPAVATAADLVDRMAWDTEDDPLLHSGSTLQQLSLEELELLLAELDR